MPLPIVRPPKIRDYSDQYQREARAAIKALDVAGVQKSVIRGVTLGATTVNVPHGLGRAPIAWQITDKTAQADVWRDSTGTVTKDTIPLKASGTVVVDLQFW